MDQSKSFQKERLLNNYIDGVNPIASEFKAKSQENNHGTVTKDVDYYDDHITIIESGSNMMDRAQKVAWLSERQGIVMQQPLAGPTPDHQVVVMQTIRESYEDGREELDIDDSKSYVPDDNHEAAPDSNRELINSDNQISRFSEQKIDSHSQDHSSFSESEDREYAFMDQSNMTANTSGIKSSVWS